MRFQCQEKEFTDIQPFKKRRNDRSSMAHFTNPNSIQDIPLVIIAHTASFLPPLEVQRLVMEPVSRSVRQQQLSISTWEHLCVSLWGLRFPGLTRLLESIEVQQRFKLFPESSSRKQLKFGVKTLFLEMVQLAESFKQSSVDLKSLHHGLHKFIEAPGVVKLALESLQSALEQEGFRTEARSIGIGTTILQILKQSTRSEDIQVQCLHCVVFLARPPGGSEGMVFQRRSSGLANSQLFGPEMDWAYSVLNVMDVHSHSPDVAAAGCWALVNLALHPAQKRALLLNGCGVSAVTAVMRQHASSAPVQFRAQFALINLVAPDPDILEEAEGGELRGEDRAGFNLTDGGATAAVRQEEEAARMALNDGPRHHRLDYPILLHVRAQAGGGTGDGTAPAPAPVPALERVRVPAEEDRRTQPQQAGRQRQEKQQGAIVTIFKQPDCLKELVVLVLQAMDTFKGEKQVVSRGCLVLHNLSLNLTAHGLLIRGGAAPRLAAVMACHGATDRFLRVSAENTLRRLGADHYLRPVMAPGQVQDLSATATIVEHPPAGGPAAATTTAREEGGGALVQPAGADEALAA
mmetsp:Transcript_727/g.1246  ORF Transcript_727/g.1246 Transcript_727/m.1246 type:complete len:576 (-) Transcript_727:285-2012(-)